MANGTQGIVDFGKSLLAIPKDHFKKILPNQIQLRATLITLRQIAKAGTMEAMNALNAQSNSDVWSEGYWILSSIMEPVIPHVACEISQKYFSLKNLSKQKVIDEVFVEESITLGVAVNGKRRAEVEVAVDASKEEIVSQAKELIAKWIEGKTIVKEIVVPKKLVNIVIKG